jgi:hypothetical protein
LGSEGDELVKWACSDEGCAAIQKYVSVVSIRSIAAISLLSRYEVQA